MNFLRFYRIILILALIAVSPLLLSAEERGFNNIPSPYNLHGQSFPVFQDSASRGKKPDAKPKNIPGKSSQDIKDARIRDQGRRSIKQVPRSIPKLKPQPVPDGIQIRRPSAPTNAPRKAAGTRRF
jgi:hypothetical protein